MELRNEIVLDGKVQKDVKVFDQVINFNISAITGQYRTLENQKRNRYTFIRVVYTGNIDAEVLDIVQTGNFIRIFGKLDSEQYKSQTGKIVYNKILCVDKVEKLNLEM